MLFTMGKLILYNLIQRMAAVKFVVDLENIVW